MSKKTNTALNIYSKFATDLTKEVEGAKCYLDEECDCYIVVARQNNRNFEHAKEYAKLALKYEGIDFSEEFEEEARKLFIKHYVKGWNNIADIDGNVIPFSYENAVKVLVNDIPDLCQIVLAFSQERKNFKLDVTVKK